MKRPNQGTHARKTNSSLPTSKSPSPSNTTQQPSIPQQPAPPSNHTPSPSNNTNSTTAWNKRVTNRNGININTLTPTNQKVSFREDAAPNIDKQNQFNVVEQQDNTFYVRATLPIKDYVTHIPTIIKSFF